MVEVKNVALGGVVAFILLAAGSLWIGYIGATMEDTSSWSDPENHRMLVIAGVCAFLAFVCLACWIAIPGKRRDD
jgi:predicted MFS family arabinose efflux permease